MNIQIGLAIIQIDLSNNSPPSILSQEQDNFVLPTIKFDKEKHVDLITAIHELSKKCVDLSTFWLNFELVDIILDEDDLTIVYGCMVPFSTKTYNNYWMATQIENSQEFNLAIRAMQILGNIH